MRWMLATLFVSNAALGAAVLEPRDAAVTDTWKAVYWCGDQRELVQVKDEYWAIYEAVSLEGALPTKENCKEASAAPGKEFVGLFAVKFRSFPPWNIFKNTCPSGVLHFGQIEGFIRHAGQEIPFMRRFPAVFGACGGHPSVEPKEHVGGSKAKAEEGTHDPAEPE